MSPPALDGNLVSFTKPCNKRSVNYSKFHPLHLSVCSMTRYFGFSRMPASLLWKYERTGVEDNLIRRIGVDDGGQTWRHRVFQGGGYLLEDWNFPTEGGACESAIPFGWTFH